MYMHLKLFNMYYIMHVEKILDVIMNHHFPMKMNLTKIASNVFLYIIVGTKKVSNVKNNTSSVLY